MVKIKKALNKNKFLTGLGCMRIKIGIYLNLTRKKYKYLAGKVSRMFDPLSALLALYLHLARPDTGGLQVTPPAECRLDYRLGSSQNPCTFTVTGGIGDVTAYSEGFVDTRENPGPGEREIIGLTDLYGLVTHGSGPPEEIAFNPFFPTNLGGSPLRLTLRPLSDKDLSARRISPGQYRGEMIFCDQNGCLYVPVTLQSGTRVYLPAVMR